MEIRGFGSSTTGLSPRTDIFFLEELVCLKNQDPCVSLKLIIGEAIVRFKEAFLLPKFLRPTPRFMSMYNASIVFSVRHFLLCKII